MTVLRISSDVASGQMDDLTPRLDDGYMRIYEGGQPASVDDPLGAVTLLAELRFGMPASPAAVDGVATFNAMTPDAAADATGTAEFARCYESDGVTAVLDCDVGVVNATAIIDTTAIVAGSPVDCTSFQLTQPKG